MSYARLALINGYCECLDHAHQFVSVNMAVSPCQVVLFWFLVSGMAIILFKGFFCCAIQCVARDTHCSAFIVILVLSLYN